MQTVIGLRKLNDTQSSRSDDNLLTTLQQRGPRVGAFFKRNRTLVMT